MGLNSLKGGLGRGFYQGLLSGLPRVMLMAHIHLVPALALQKFRWALGIYCLGTFESFPKLWVPLLGVPIVRMIIFLGLYWGSPILGNHHL